MSEPRILVVDLAATSRNWSLTDEGRARIRESSPPGWDVRFVDAPTVSDGDGGTRPSAEALRTIGDAEAYVGFGIHRELFTAARRLRWVHSAAAGVGAALFPEMLASDVTLTNSAGIHALPIAQHVVAGVIHLLRSFDIAIDQQRSATWDKAPFTGDASTVRELADCCVLIVGAGGIGQTLSRAMAHFGARCTAVRRRPELGVPGGCERVVGPDGLDGELARADVVILATPATAQTDTMLNARRLALLPRDAIVVNVGRGTLLDEEALVGELRSGRLRGAVLDVFREEPLAPTSPLWQLRQVVLTPHVAAVSPRRFWDRQLDLLTDNWQRYVKDERLRNVVDKTAGY